MAKITHEELILLFGVDILQMIFEGELDILEKMEMGDNEEFIPLFREDIFDGSFEGEFDVN